MKLFWVFFVLTVLLILGEGLLMDFAPALTACAGALAWVIAIFGIMTFLIAYAESTK